MWTIIFKINVNKFGLKISDLSLFVADAILLIELVMVAVDKFDWTKLEDE